MKKYLSFFIFSLLILYTFFWQLPKTIPVKISPLPNTTSTLLIPLDSRPVCTTLPKQLGSLAGTKVILPPIGFLDNYQKPADREKLYLWLQDNCKYNNNIIISSDLLIHGGLISSRIPLGTEKEQQKFLETYKILSETSPNMNSCIFSIIPRLLVSDHLLPDRWYQWHLMKYSKLKDMTETFNDPYFTEELIKRQQEIPDKILAKYLYLYRNNDIFNKNLLTSANKNTFIVIGQDDGASFGLPNINTNHAKMYAKNMDNSHITYGADEIAASIIARNYLKQRHATPKIYIYYADKQAEFTYMPFMAASIGVTLRDKLKLIGAAETYNINDADIILYINCGNEKFHPGKTEVDQLQNLLNTSKKIALLDLSVNYDINELLMPSLLAYNFPLNKLCAYAGWNTFSNSAGTVIAQAVIFSERLKELPQEKLPSLYEENLLFLCNRIIDDYFYQKLFCPDLKSILSLQGFDINKLSLKGEKSAQQLTQQYLNRKTKELLHYNIGRTPYYIDKNSTYYLNDLSVQVYFPWNRVFEVGIDLNCKSGIQKNR